MKHLHIAERCRHGETRRTLCDHHLPWAAYRVRQVPCHPSFCSVVRRRQQLKDETRAHPADHSVSRHTFTAFARVRLTVTAGDQTQALSRVWALEGEEHDIESLRRLGVSLEAVTFGEAGDVEPHATNDSNDPHGR